MFAISMRDNSELSAFSDLDSRVINGVQNREYRNNWASGYHQVELRFVSLFAPKVSTGWTNLAGFEDLIVLSVG